MPEDLEHGILEVIVQYLIGMHEVDESSLHPIEWCHDFIKHHFSHLIIGDSNIFTAPNPTNEKYYGFSLNMDSFKKLLTSDFVIDEEVMTLLCQALNSVIYLRYANREKFNGLFYKDGKVKEIGEPDEIIILNIIRSLGYLIMISY